jgi:hypothetical protein
MEPPANPAGAYVADANLNALRRGELIAEIERAPAALREALDGLTVAQLDAKYRNWSIRQIACHLADSHAHSYIRFKWALTEDEPVIKAYDENRWAELADAQSGPADAALALLTGVHEAWARLMRLMTPDEFARGFNHPETGKLVVLNDALGYYAWHARHHTAAIRWVREHRIA